RLLKEASRALVGEWGQKLAELPVRLIEEPAFRLAGAEEAIRLLVATIEQALEYHQPLWQDLTARAAEAHQRLRALVEPDGRSDRSGWRRPACSAEEVLELLRSYPKCRLQGLVLEYMASAFVSLRGHLSDELREMNYCRTRLGELQRRLSEHAESGMG